jgi:hypothetical protein
VNGDRNDERGTWVELPILVGVSLAMVMTWPLVLYLGTDIPAEYGDPLYNTWHVAWVGHALLHQPLDLFQANPFWPHPDSLAFNDVMVGYAPAGVFASQGVHAALVVNGVLILFAFTLAFVGAYLLARELGARWPGAVAAGAAFAYAPWRLSHVRHLNVLSSGGIALTLFLLIRGYRRGNGRMVLAGWLVAAWQMTLGFSLGLQFAYLLLVLGAIAVVFWLLRGRPRLQSGVVRASAVGICVLAIVVVVLARPYLRVVDAHPEAKRSADMVGFYSPPPKAFLTAAPESKVWGDATAERRETVRWPIEQALFPGLTIMLLAILGLWSKVYPPGVRVGLACGVAVTAVIAMGLPSYPDDGSFTPYRLLYDFAPGWDGVRTPGRIFTLTSLGLALLAGAGLCLVVRAVKTLPSLRQGNRGSIAAGVAGCALVGAILLEGYGPIPRFPVPPPPPEMATAPEPQLHLPSDYGHDLIYTYWSTNGFPKMVNGIGSFEPADLYQTRALVTGFPDAVSVEYLRNLGVRTVFLHPGFAAGTPWADAARRPIAGLPLRREVRTNVVLYHLGPKRPA